MRPDLRHPLRWYAEGEAVSDWIVAAATRTTAAAERKTMKTMLFLDGMPERVPLLRRGETVEYARDLVQFANWLLINGTPDVISFDHDLSHVRYERSGGYGDPDWPPSGTNCARWCIVNGFIPKLVIIHSWNPEGSKRIADCFVGTAAKVLVQLFNPNKLHLEAIPTQTD
jgi:hypothetical protein